MKRYFSFKVCAAFFGVFVIGAIIGGLLVTNFSDQRFSKFLKRANDPASMTVRINQKLTDEYHLSQDQQNRIAPLTRTMAEHLRQLRQQFGKDVLAAMDDYHQKVAEQMTSEQQAGYQQMNIERKRRATDMLLPDTKPK